MTIYNVCVYDYISCLMIQPLMFDDTLPEPLKSLLA